MYMSKLRGDFIMTTKKMQLEEPMMKVNLGGWGVEYILPWNDAVQVLSLMRSAIRVEANTRTISIRGSGIKVSRSKPRRLALSRQPRYLCRENHHEYID